MEYEKNWLGEKNADVTPGENHWFRLYQQILRHEMCLLIIVHIQIQITRLPK